MLFLFVLELLLPSITNQNKFFMKKVLLSYLMMCFFMVSAAFAQDKIVTGKVTGAGDGLPLPGVSVTVKGNTSVGTQTDANGNFRLAVPATAKILVFRYIGFLTVESAVSNTLKVNLQEDQKQLSFTNIFIRM